MYHSKLPDTRRNSNKTLNISTVIESVASTIVSVPLATEAHGSLRRYETKLSNHDHEVSHNFDYLIRSLYLTVESCVQQMLRFADQ